MSFRNLIKYSFDLENTILLEVRTWTGVEVLSKTWICKDIPVYRYKMCVCTRVRVRICTKPSIVYYLQFVKFLNVWLLRSVDKVYVTCTRRVDTLGRYVIRTNTKFIQRHLADCLLKNASELCYSDIFRMVIPINKTSYVAICCSLSVSLGYCVQMMFTCVYYNIHAVHNKFETSKCFIASIVITRRRDKGGK